MLFPLLAACACPSFAEMEVVGDSGDADFVARIEETVAEFADWTGREGVCVPGVKVEEEVWVRGEAVGAVYGGPHRWIEISAEEGGPERSTRHELCHALDDQEGHSTAHAELFPGDDIDDTNLYPTAAARRGEAFAQACAWGASGVELIVAVDAACGGSRWGLDFAYAQTHVYTGWPRNPTTSSGVDRRLTPRTLGVGRGVTVVDAVGIDGTLVLLADWTHPTGSSWGLVQVDPTSGAFLGRVMVGPGTVHEAGAQLVRTDGPALLLVGWDDGDRALYEVDLATGTAAVVVEGLDLPRLYADAAWSEGVLYVTGQWPDRTPLTVAWAGGATTDLAAPAPGYAIAPVPGGFEAYSDAGLERYVDGAWSVLPRVGAGGGDVVPVAGGWRLALTLAAVGVVPVLVDAETGAYGLLADPCQTLDTYAASWVAFGEEVLLIDSVAADELGRVPITVLGPG